MASLGFAPSYASVLPGRFPPIRLNDYAGAAIGQGGGQDGPSDDFYVQEVLTKIVGKHQLKFGAEFRYGISSVENPLAGINFANLQFSRNFTSLRPNVATLTAADGGNAFASYLLGYMASTNVQVSPIFDWRSSYTAAFVQEDWRISNRLTLNAGLRWDYEAPLTETGNQVNGGFDPAVPALVCPACPASGLPSTLNGGLTFADGAFYKRDLNNFGPRVGFTYTPTRTAVVRGGYGLTFLDSSTDRGTSSGFTRTTTYVASLDANRTPANRLSNPFPTGILQPSGPALGPATALGTGISYHIGDRKIPEFHTWSIGVQQQLPWRSVLDVSYIGSATRKLAVTRPINDLTREQLALGDAFLNALVPNPFVGLMPDGGARNTAPTIQRRELMRPYPQFAGINEQLVPIGTRDYQALQISWDKRLSQGVHMSVAYTGSRNVEALAPLNQGEPLYEEVTNTHRPHVLRLTGGWQMPSFEGRGTLARLLLGGWQINATTFFRSGLNVPMPGAVDQIGDAALDNPTTARWFNTCTLTTAGVRQSCANESEQPAFQIRPENALDTTGARLEGVYRSEPLNVDMSFFKTIRVHGRSNFQFRVEMFNAFNGSSGATRTRRSPRRSSARSPRPSRTTRASSSWRSGSASSSEPPSGVRAHDRQDRRRRRADRLCRWSAAAARQAPPAGAQPPQTAQPPAAPPGGQPPARPRQPGGRGQGRGGGMRGPQPLPFENHDGYTAIFDGTSLKGWDGDPKFWRADGGAIVGETTAENKLTENTFIIWRGGEPADFELKLEYRINATNSGIQVRSVHLPAGTADGLGMPVVGKWVMKGYQADIDVDNRFTGQIYEERGRTVPRDARPVQLHRPGRRSRRSSARSRPPTDALKAHREAERLEPGPYHRARQHAHRDPQRPCHQRPVDDDTKGRALKGLIGFQCHVGDPMKVEFRNIWLKQYLMSASHRVRVTSWS